MKPDFHFILFYDQKKLHEYEKKHRLHSYRAFSRIESITQEREKGNLTKFVLCPSRIIMPDFVQNPDATEIIRIVTAEMIENGVSLQFLGEYVLKNYGQDVYEDVIVSTLFETHITTKITKATVVAEPRKLQASWTLEDPFIPLDHKLQVTIKNP